MKYIIDNINNYTKDELFDFLNKINEEKRKKIDKYLNPQRKKQSIVGEILLEKLLKEYNIDYEKVIIKYNKNGKPYITNYPIYFNLSHSYNYVICAVSLKEIGVDIERIRKIDSKVLRKVDIEILTDNNEEILRLFTLKEASLKMNGWTFNELDDTRDFNCKTIINSKYVATICEKKDSI